MTSLESIKIWFSVFCVLCLFFIFRILLLNETISSQNEILVDEFKFKRLKVKLAVICEI